MMDLPHILIAVCAAGCLALVYAEYASEPPGEQVPSGYSGNDTLRTASKFVASGAFVTLGITLTRAVPEGTAQTYAWVILVGLVFGAIGDIALLGRSQRAFLGGLVAFLIGHVAYVIAAAVLVSPSAWFSGDSAIAFAAMPVVAGGIALRWLWPNLGKMRVPVIVYVLAIVTMVIAALAVWRTHALPNPQRTWLLVGAVLFFISDIAVARDKFVAKGFANRVWGLPAYFSGQLMIAWSLAGL
jgi:uncharacterized membrane protein YhhN